jgi:hypothetical protein
VDANQTEIVDGLRKCGISVENIKEPVDLLVWAKAFCPCCKAELPDGQVVPVEIKNPDGGRLTKAQVEFIARWPGKVHVVETLQEALRALLGEEVMR